MNFREQKEEVLLSASTVFQFKIQLYGSSLTLKAKRRVLNEGCKDSTKNSHESEHQQFEIASGFCFVLLLKANPQMRGLRCVSGVSGGTERKKQSISICQIRSRSAFLKFQTLLLNFKGNEDPEVKEDLF